MSPELVIDRWKEDDLNVLKVEGGSESPMIAGAILTTKLTLKTIKISTLAGTN